MGETLNPLTVITTLQPLLLGWLSAIAFFVTLAAVAVLSKGRKWYELVCLFFVIFVGLASTSFFVSNLVLDITVVEFEVISLEDS